LRKQNLEFSRKKTTEKLVEGGDQREIGERGYLRFKLQHIRILPEKNPDRAKRLKEGVSGVVNTFTQ